MKFVDHTIYPGIGIGWHQSSGIGIGWNFGIGTSLVSTDWGVTMATTF